MNEHAYIVMKTGKSKLFPYFVNGKMAFIGVSVLVPENNIPSGSLIANVKEWADVDKDIFIELDNDSVDTIVFYSYDAYNEVKGHVKRIRTLLLKYFHGNRRSVFMFKSL